MAKATEDDDEDQPEEMDEEVGENQPLRTFSHEEPYEEVEDFTTHHNLADEIELFRKASLLLSHASDPEQIEGLTTLKESSALHRESTHKWHQPPYLYFTISICSLGAIEQGWAQTGMNGANLYIPEAFGIATSSTHDSFILGLMNCGLYLAQGLIGAWMAEPVNNRLGRRGAIFAATLLCLLGNLGSGLSGSWPFLLFSRLMLGTGLGLNSTTVSVFAAESAPSYIRGGLAVSWQMFTAFGIFVGFLANVGFVMAFENKTSATHDQGWIWRGQLIAPLLPTIPLLGLIYTCPESPSWLLKRGRYDQAFSSLLRLRNTPLQAATEIYSTHLSRHAHKPSPPSSPSSSSFRQNLTLLLTLPRNLHALHASYVVMLSQQLCGINIIAFYSSTLFLSSGFTPLAANWASVIFGLVNFLGAFPAVWTMDSFGRRSLLLWTLPPMAVVMAGAGVSFDALPSAGSVRLVVLAGLIYTFCLLYSPGLGPVPVAYSAEVFPLAVRELGMSCAISTAALWATILSLTFPVLLQSLGEGRTFGLYALLNVLAWVLCWLFVRETKGVQLEDMDKVFEGSVGKFVGETWVERGRWCGGRRTRGKGKGWVEVPQQEGGVEEERLEEERGEG